MTPATTSKLIVAAILLVTFLAGGFVGAYLKSEPGNAFNEETLKNPPATENAVAKRVVAPSNAVRRERVVTTTRPHKRSWKHSALIIAGSAGAGSAIGALAGGGRGAAIGALSGGAAGLVYDLVTRNKR